MTRLFSAAPTPLLITVSFTLLFTCPQSSYSQSETANPSPVSRQAETRPAEDIEEVLVVGQPLPAKTDIRPDTELLMNVAGAGLDPLAAILSLPGVTFASDYSSEPAVRGSSPADNGYLIDLMPARYVFHLFGNSIFNHNLIHSFDLYPAAFSSEFGNATGAIVDVRLRDPKQQRFTTTLDASFLSSGAMIETAITEDSAIYASYRRSLIDQFINEEDLDDEEEGVVVNSLPVADDYQVKATWDLTTQQRLSFLAAGAGDKAKLTFGQTSNTALTDPDLSGPASLDTRFDSQGLLWDWQSASGKMSSSLVLSRLDESDEYVYGTGQFFDIATVRDIAHGRFLIDVASQHQITTGVYVEDIDFDLVINAKVPICSDFDTNCLTTDAPLVQFDDNFQVKATTLYLEDRWQPSDWFSMRFGLHQLSDDFLDDKQLDPRFRADFTLNDEWNFYVAYGTYSQISEPEFISPATGNPSLEYEESTHSVIGIKNRFGDGWSWQIDLYHKEMSKLPLGLTPGVDADFANRYANDLSGEAAGFEFLLNKELTDKLYGWVAVSVAETTRRNDRSGVTRDYEFDKPIIVNLVANYDLGRGWMLGAKWSLQSGALYTPIVDTQASVTNPGVTIPVYGELNSERLPFYHRLDLRVEYTKETGFGMFSFYVDVLNAYFSENVQGYEFAPNGEDTLSSPPSGYGNNVPVRQFEGLPFFPSVGFKIQF